MKPDLHKRHYFINQYKNNHSTLCRRSSHNSWFRGKFAERVFTLKTGKNWNANIDRKIWGDGIFRTRPSKI